MLSKASIGLLFSPLLGLSVSSQIDNQADPYQTDHCMEFFEVNILKAYQSILTRLVDEGTHIRKYIGPILNSKSEWHQPKIIRTTVLQGGAEMAGGMVARFPVDGRQDAAAHNVVNTPVQEELQATTARTTRAMARRAGGF